MSVMPESVVTYPPGYLSSKFNPRFAMTQFDLRSIEAMSSAEEVRRLFR
jgi:hypothetical protein